MNGIKKQNLIPYVLVIIDALTLMAAFFTAYYLRNVGPFRIFLPEVQPLSVYLRALPFAALLLISIFYFRGLYQPKQRLSPMSELLTVTQSLTLWVLLIMAGSYLVKYDYSRIIVILFFVSALLLVNTARWLVGKIEALLAHRGIGLTNIIIVGAGKPGRLIAEQLRKYRRHGFNVLGFIDNTSRNNTLPVLGNLDSLYDILLRHNVEYVYFADPRISYEDILTLVHNCPINTVEFKITSNIFSLINEVRDLRDIEAIPSLSLKKSSPTPLYHGVKQTIDIMLSSVMLIVTLPFWILIALLIKTDSTGPVFIQQERVGKNGRIFTILKFRTMKKETPLYEEAPYSTHDSRVTTVGAFLRKTSLDELPQLINVLKGEMSIVGPRPEMPFIVKQYSSWQKRRLMVKPGITGLWQILGRKDIPLRDNLEYDFYYINNQSIILDLIILLKTIPFVLLGKGAY